MALPWDAVDAVVCVHVGVDARVERLLPRGALGVRLPRCNQILELLPCDCTCSTATKPSERAVSRWLFARVVRDARLRGCFVSEPTAPDIYLLVLDRFDRTQERMKWKMNLLHQVSPCNVFRLQCEFSSIIQWILIEQGKSRQRAFPKGKSVGIKKHKSNKDFLDVGEDWLIARGTAVVKCFLRHSL